MLSKLKLKYIQSLGQKKFRDEDAVFIAEGPKLVNELLDSGNILIKELYALEDWILDNRQKLGNTPVTTVSSIELERISQLTTPNKVVVIAQQRDATLPQGPVDSIVLALDGIQDPGNMGTIIRIADWFGIHQVVASPESADCYNPKVVQATMGSIGRVNVFYTDLEDWLSQQQETGIYAAVLDGHDISTVKKISKGIILIGNESKGIHPALLALANNRVTIPRKGHAESLNAAVATGIILSHIL